MFCASTDARAGKLSCAAAASGADTKRNFDGNTGSGRGFSSSAVPSPTAEQLQDLSSEELATVKLFQVRQCAGARQWQERASVPTVATACSEAKLV